MGLIPSDVLVLSVAARERGSALAVEGALIERILAGEAAAYRPLVERHQRRVYAIVRRLVGNDSDADDLCQQAFIAAFDALDRFDPGRPFSSWVNRIAINLAKDHLKSSRHREQPLPEAESTLSGLIDPALDPELSAVAAQRRRQIARALARLALPDREVLILKDMEGLSFQEMRAILGRPITALKIRAFRARLRLRAILIELEASDG